jgi:hypothetical protein
MRTPIFESRVLIRDKRQPSYTRALFFTLCHEIIRLYGMRQSLRQWGHRLGLGTRGIHQVKQCLQCSWINFMSLLYHKDVVSQIGAGF